jgi:ketosteroid isomerase-like protein
MLAARAPQASPRRSEEGSMNIISDEFPEAQRAIDKRITEILDAVQTKEFERLAGYHLKSPKFTKFNDIDPLERQDIETCNRVEQEELGAVDSFRAQVDELKIDVFGPVAVATGILEATVEIDGQRETGRTRTTVVFVDDDGDWKIVHEHLSTLPSSP